MGSVAECLLLATSPLKLPGEFRDRAVAPLMSGDGWIPGWRVQKLHHGAGTVIAALLCRNFRDEFKTAAEVVGDLIRITAARAQSDPIAAMF